MLDSNKCLRTSYYSTTFSSGSIQKLYLTFRDISRIPSLRLAACWSSSSDLFIILSLVFLSWGNAYWTIIHYSLKDFCFYCLSFKQLLCLLQKAIHLLYDKLKWALQFSFRLLIFLRGNFVCRDFMIHFILGFGCM